MLSESIAKETVELIFLLFILRYASKRASRVIFILRSNDFIIINKPTVWIESNHPPLMQEACKAIYSDWRYANR